MSKLWHDDVRRPPDNTWLWARTNAEAVAFLLDRDTKAIREELCCCIADPLGRGLCDYCMDDDYRPDPITECSLDHDLGREDVDPDDPESYFIAGSSQYGSGLDLVTWMIANDRVPEKVTIHSWNPAGAKAMAYALYDANYGCVIEPFRLPFRVT